MKYICDYCKAINTNQSAKCHNCSNASVYKQQYYSSDSSVNNQQYALINEKTLLVEIIDRLKRIEKKLT